MSVGPSRGRLSTRPQSTDDTPSILVSDLFRGGVARSDALPVVRGWSSGGVSAEIEVTVIDERVECVYRSSLGRREASYVLEVSWTTPNFGGDRPWLHCASCHRRCGRLFLDDPYLVCRQCARLRYPSQFGEKARHEERVKRAKQLRRSLGGEPVLGAPLPARPKGMHRSTFLRIYGEIREIEGAERARIEKEVRKAEKGLRGAEPWHARLRELWRDGAG